MQKVMADWRSVDGYGPNVPAADKFSPLRAAYRKELWWRKRLGLFPLFYSNMGDGMYLFV